MTDRVFIDTNVFVYAEDANEPTKQTVAQRVVEELATGGTGVISTQVLVEYISAARKKLGLSLAECRPDPEGRIGGRVPPAAHRGSSVRADH